MEALKRNVPPRVAIVGKELFKKRRRSGIEIDETSQQQQVLNVNVYNRDVKENTVEQEVIEILNDEVLRETSSLPTFDQNPTLKIFKPRRTHEDTEIIINVDFLKFVIKI
jgi:hypothetical protein